MSLDFIDLTSLPQRIILQSLVGVLVLSGIAAIACLILRRNPLHRHTVATLALASCLLLPLVSAWTATQGRPLVRLQVLPPSSTEPLIEATQVPSEGYFSEVLVETETPGIDPSATLTLLYGAGVLFGFAKLALGLLYARNLVKTSVPASREVRSLLLHDRRDVRIRLTGRLSGPVVVGLLRPLILFPTELVRALDDKGIRQVIAHELSHIEGRHLWHAMLHRVTAIVLWPVPTIHFVRRQAMVAQEDLCDSKAMAEGSAADYARLLVDLGQRRPTLSHAWPVCGIWSHNLTLEARIKSLLDPHRKPTTPMKPLTKAAVFGATLSTLILLAGTQLVQAQDPVASGQAAPVQEIAILPAPAGQAAPAIVQTATADRAQRKAARLATRQARRAKRAQAPRIAVNVQGQAVTAPRAHDPFDENRTPGPQVGFDSFGRTAPTQPLPSIAEDQEGRIVIAPSTPAPLRGTRVRGLTGTAPGVAVPSGQHSLIAPLAAPGGVRAGSTAPGVRVTRRVARMDVAPAIAANPLGQQRKTRGVPVLKDLPVIGRLFREDQDTNMRQGLPAHVSSQSAPSGQHSQERDLVEAKAARDARAAEGQAEIAIAQEEARSKADRMVIERRGQDRTDTMKNRAAMEQDRMLHEHNLAKLRVDQVSEKARLARADAELSKAKMLRDQAAAKALRSGKRTIIRNATVIIHEDGSIVISGGKTETLKPAAKPKKGK